MIAMWSVGRILSCKIRGSVDKRTTRFLRCWVLYFTRRGVDTIAACGTSKVHMMIGSLT